MDGEPPTHNAGLRRCGACQVGAGLPDQVLLAHTRSLVMHEQALQHAVLDHLREIHARHLHLRLGFSSLFDYAVRELGYSEGAAWRRIKAMRLCAETAGTRERLQDGSLTLSAAAQLPNTFDLQQRTATATAAADRGSAPATPELLPGGTGTAPGAGALGAEAAAPARPAPALDAARRQELVAQASGKSTREVKQLLAGVAPELARPAERLRALGEDRWELKVEIDAACQRGIEQLRALLSHVDPHLTVGQLVERLVQDGLQRYDPGRPRRGRGARRRKGRRAGRETCGGSTPVRAKAAAAPGTAPSAARSVADRGPHATVPTPRPTPPADHSMPTALAAVDRGRSAPSPAKRAGVAQLDGRARPQPEAAGASGGSAQPPHRARRSPAAASPGCASPPAPHPRPRPCAALPVFSASRSRSGVLRSRMRRVPWRNSRTPAGR